MQNLRKYVKLLNRKHKTEMEYKWGLVSIIPALSLCTMIESIQKKIEKVVTILKWKRGLHLLADLIVLNIYEVCGPCTHCVAVKHYKSKSCFILSLSLVPYTKKKICVETRTLEYQADLWPPIFHLHFLSVYTVSLCFSFDSLSYLPPRNIYAVSFS